ncbi:MAG: amidotransferase [Bacteroidales bacterium]|nr:amidotransferase [Bacteroidales bacterium]
MNIGLLVCDHIQKEFSGYPELFKTILPQNQFEIFNVCDGLFPKFASDCDAWIITGSKFSVYDQIDWIIKLKSFVGDISVADKYCIGVCFGHQMLGEAMGGKVQKSEKGWCVGVHQFEILERESWMMPFFPNLDLLMSCQDQIKVLPENSVILAQSPMCPVGIIKIGNKMLGIQGHPEFSAEYVKSLMIDRTNRIGEEVVKAGIDSLKTPTQSLVLAQWMANFLNQ